MTMSSPSQPAFGASLDRHEDAGVEGPAAVAVLEGLARGDLASSAARSSGTEIGLEPLGDGVARLWLFEACSSRASAVRAHHRSHH